MTTRLAIALAGFAVTSVFFINLCNLIFACGCASLWAGADDHCNIHHASGPVCPVCSHGAVGYALVFLAIAGPQMALALGIKNGPWWLRLALVLLLFPVLGGLVMGGLKKFVF